MADTLPITERRIPAIPETGSPHHDQPLGDNTGMRAWFMDGYDGVDHLRLGETQDPAPGPNQILLRPQFAALNPADAFLAQAMYPAKPVLPHILGRDGVGEVIAVGTGVSS